MHWRPCVPIFSRKLDIIPSTSQIGSKQKVESQDTKSQLAPLLSTYQSPHRWRGGRAWTSGRGIWRGSSASPGSAGRWQPWHITSARHRAAVPASVSPRRLFYKGGSREQSVSFKYQTSGLCFDIFPECLKCKTVWHDLSFFKKWLKIGKKTSNLKQFPYTAYSQKPIDRYAFALCWRELSLKWTAAVSCLEPGGKFAVCWDERLNIWGKCLNIYLIYI